VRAILATNENLQSAIAEGRFRQDLFYRINVIHIELPSLRERPDDIPLLADHFLRCACTEYSRDVQGFSTSAMNAMLTYAWPGNIRELENAIQRSVLLTKTNSIDVDVLPPSIHGHGQTTASPTQSNTIRPFSSLPSHSSISPSDSFEINRSSFAKQTLSEALEGPERCIILQVLKANDWNRNITADQLGINRTTLYKKMKKLGIETLA